MSAIEFPEYVRCIQSILNETVAAGHVLSIQFQVDQRSTKLGFFTGILFFADGTELHFREYIDLSVPEPRQMYVYQMRF